ncbi:MAG TPA: pyruvate kinase [Acidimicrobiia bacterium]|nr:pyruvate kinase [Acidimicrobiia bacterium]
MSRKTKIIATLGPASASADVIGAMVGAGLDVARLNFSHGDHESHRRMISCVREAAGEHRRAVAVLQDIQGPRIRVGTFPGGAVELTQGSRVRLVSGEGEGDAGRVFVQHLDTIRLRPGDRVLCADGMVVLTVRDLDAKTVVVDVVTGGTLADHKGVALPGVEVGLPAVTPKDEADLAFGRDVGVDLVAASFVTSGADIRLVRSVAGDVPVIAKIERAEAYANLGDILDEADGAMVARGDLGVELGFEPLPRVQKEIIARTHDAGGISITATEMLESMTASPRPTRAEVTDVANAVLDGSDAVMLSAETAVGKYPVRTIEVMARICTEAERSPGYPARVTAGFLADDVPFPTAIAQAVADTANILRLGTVVAFTESGNTARLVSRYRPNSRIVAFTPSADTFHRLAIVWGVTPLLFPRYASTDEMIAQAERVLLEQGLVASGEWVAMVAGIPPNQQASTNLLKLHVVGG